MPHARVFEYLQHVAHFPWKTHREHLLLTQNHPSRSPFYGLFVAALMAAGFWAGLIVLILRLR